MQILDSSLACKTVPAPRRARGRSEPPSPTVDIQPLPRWARTQDGDRTAAAFRAGAGLALFDQILRGGPDGAEPVFAGCLRQRLALRAAESCATLSRLREDAAALRDAEHLAGGGAASPAARLHRLFRRAASQPARLARVAESLGLDARIDAGALVEAAAAAPDPLAAAAHASAAAMKRPPQAVDAELFAFIVADLAVASRLGWARPVPLLAVAILHPSLRRGTGERRRRPRPTDDDWPDSVARAYGLALVEAHAIAVDLARRSQRILAVTPMLRARGARRVIDMLLADDAVAPAAAARAGLSDRAARRLFDRLVALGAVRELSGRDSFRIYGL